MRDNKHKIRLTAEQETMLITLYSKAIPSTDVIIEDKHAAAMIEQIDYDFEQLKVPTGTSLTVCIRAKKFDEYVLDYVSNHPEKAIIQLGCGLDSRYSRINHEGVVWYDLDMPDVIELRKNFFKETSNYRMIACSVTDLDWIEQIQPKSQVGMVIAEGLMIYLTETQVKDLILILKDVFPGCRLVFDAYRRMTARWAKDHPSLKATEAAIQWGIDDPKAIENWVQ